MEDLPVNAGSRETGTDATGCEAILLEVLDVPRIDTGRTEENTTFHLESVVQTASLSSGGILSRIEPVH